MKKNIQDLSAQEVLDIMLKNGGISYNFTTGELNPKTGYMVSFFGTEEKGVVPSVKAIEMHMSAHRNFFKSEVTFFGAWLDKETDIWYFDASQNVQDKDTAMFLAEHNHQLAVYDCEKETSIYL